MGSTSLFKGIKIILLPELSEILNSLPRRPINDFFYLHFVFNINILYIFIVHFASVAYSIKINGWVVYIIIIFVQVYVYLL